MHKLRRQLFGFLPATRQQVANLSVHLFNFYEGITVNQAEHAQALRDLKTQNDKARAEQVAALAKLQAALDAAGGTTAEVDEAMAELKGSIQTDDDLNPDTEAQG